MQSKNIEHILICEKWYMFSGIHGKHLKSAMSVYFYIFVSIGYKIYFVV